MNVKLMLVSETGEVLDGTDLLTAAEWNHTREHNLSAIMLIQELRKVEE